MRKRRDPLEAANSSVKVDSEERAAIASGVTIYNAAWTATSDAYRQFPRMRATGIGSSPELRRGNGKVQAL